MNLNNSIFDAVRIKNNDVVLDWLVRSENLDILNEDHENLLQVAIAYKNTPLCEKLIDYPLDFNNVNNTGQVALHYAVEHGNLFVLKELLSKPNIEIDHQDSFGNAPIWTAVFNARGNYKMVELLIKYGADPSLKNKTSRSALDFASQINDKKLTKILLD